MDKYCRVRKRIRDEENEALESALDVLQLSHVPDEIEGRDSEMKSIAALLQEVLANVFRRSHANIFCSVTRRKWAAACT